MIEDDAPADPVASRRPAYLKDLAGGVDRFFEPRRTSCPWCASDALRGRLRTTDLLLHKPGRFVLDECRDCGHVFQNPRLNPAGLEFYYRDCYDGLGEKNMTGMFESMKPELVASEMIKSPRAFNHTSAGVVHCQPGRDADRRAAVAR